MNHRKWSPAQLEQELKKKIIGQDEYLHDLSTCIWLHNQRRQHFLRTGDKLGKPKYNMLIIGKSGMGKTSAIQAAAGLLDIPVVIEDASELRGSGWKGKQVSEIVRDIAQATKGIDKHASKPDEFAIVVLDEMDKALVDRTGDKSFSPVSNLLKFVEGMEAACGDGTSCISMKTDNLLFIASGAFDGLKEQVLKRIQPKSIGFSSEGMKDRTKDENVLKYVTVDDLVSFGVSEQLLGRFPMLCVLNELGVTEYKKILLESEISPVKQLNYLFKKEYGVSISVTEPAALTLAEQVKKSPLGARALHGKVANLFKDTLYYLQDDTAHTGYRLDYDEGFIIKSLCGKRSVSSVQVGSSPFILTKYENERILNVKLDMIAENDEAIRVYAEEIFEPFETERFGEFPDEGLIDRYNYMTIKAAKYFTAAAIAELFLGVKRFGRIKDMLNLLGVIREMTIDYGKTAIHPLERLEKRLLYRLEDYEEYQINEIRKIAWQVVKKYALLLADINKGADMNDESIFE